MPSQNAIQIVKPVNHAFQLDPQTLKSILGAAEIKDRYAVVISIAGALRKGKSFLLNFILKYLYAQYKRHNVTDWVGGEMVGFKSRGGRQPETTGIWMWSEIFTHDFPNGEKVAIILLDTQGIFDNRSSTKDNTVTFAISMMLASVQCFNVMHQIQEDDFQHLELFSEYGRLALQQSSETPFQKLLFVVRDWPYADDNAYGDGQSVIDDLLKETDIQAHENHQLRRNIKSCFEKIGAFLLPYPGAAVATGHFSGNIQDIDAEFLKDLKVLVPSLCAPENLIVKKINGKKVKAGEMILFLQTYVNIFNGGSLPEPKSILLATAATSNLLLFNECFALYNESMQNSILKQSKSEGKPYYTQFELLELHNQLKDKSIAQFQTKPKLGGVEVIKPFEIRLDHDITEKYKHFQTENDFKRKRHEEMMKTTTRALYSDCLKMYVDSMQTSIAKVESFFSKPDLQNVHATAMNGAISKFQEDKTKGWNDDFIDSTIQKLNSDIQVNYMQFERENEKKEKFMEDMKNKSDAEIKRAKEEARVAELERTNKKAEAVNKNIMIHTNCVTQYINAMRKAIIEKQPFFEEAELQQAHDKAKLAAISEFSKNRIEGGDEDMFKFRLENEIDTNFVNFMHQNEEKRKAIESAKDSEALRNNILELQRQIVELQNRPSGGDDGSCSIL